MQSQTFDIITRIEVSTKTLGFSINEYKFNSFSTDTDLINTFFNKGGFKKEDFHKIIRTNRDKTTNFLEPAFNFSKINFSDFQELTKSQVYKFVWDNISPYEYREIEEETILFEKVKKFFDSNKNEKYFIISKEFFDQTYDKDLNLASDKLIGYDAICYVYYFLVLWIDADSKILTVTEFLWD